MKTLSYAISATAAVALLIGAGCTTSTNMEVDDTPGIDVEVNGGVDGDGDRY